MDKKILEIIDELIAALLVSSTSDHFNGYEGHDHRLFDDVDERRLQELSRKIKEALNAKAD